jgi:hypothetical protein
VTSVPWPGVAKVFRDEDHGRGYQLSPHWDEGCWATAGQQRSYLAEPVLQSPIRLRCSAQLPEDARRRRVLVRPESSFALSFLFGKFRSAPVLRRPD